MENKKNRKWILILTFLGIIVSSYLTYYRVTTNPLTCNFGSCDIVQKSEYSVMMGVPVSVLGMIYYVMLLILLFKFRGIFTKLWVIWGVLFSTYLTVIEIFVIKAICGWCITSFAIILLIAFLYFKKGKPARDLSVI